MRKRKVDRPFFVIVSVLVLAGFFMFSSASLGLLVRDGVKFSSAMFSQIFLGLFLGIIAMSITSKVDYKKYKKSGKTTARQVLKKRTKSFEKRFAPKTTKPKK